ncbi:MAG: N-acetylmuramoyl-L-alanine amidase [Gemmatimonadaceae bacterium]|nr:N-acetylmuramoyl-L-alanine amidase [Gemmatimonadaceae bacterium]
MTFSLIWLPEVLRSAGLKVAPLPGWETRGRGEFGPLAGIICHHTAGQKSGNMPSLGLIRDGRPDLAGPLSQLGLGRDGTYYIVAAGRCNHAGAGIWQGQTNGNQHFIGIEAENTGRANDLPWPAVQMDAYRRGVAAILRHAGLDADAVCGHKEYARPRGRKSDPTFDMVAFRTAVRGLLVANPEPVLIPAAEPSGEARRTLRRGASGPLVASLQAALRITPADGIFGAGTEAALRAFQRARGLVPDGIAGPTTWAALDAAG